jgi:Zn-dependent protease with chaperone function
MYLTQSVLHAFIALILVELSFYVWETRDHLSMSRYRILTLTFPVFMFPLFQILSPERGSWYFRYNTALFDSQRWLDINIFNIFPFALLFLLFLTGISAIFVVQEILPIFRARESSPGCLTCNHQDERMHSLLDEICGPVRIEKPSFMVIDESFPVLVTQGVKSHTIIISNHLMEILDDEQLKGALTHEIVHMMRGSNLRTQLIYLLRMIMFYNVVSLVEFRRIVHDEEFICDGITVSLTGNPPALIRAIREFYYYSPESRTASMTGIKERIESHSHNLVLDERIKNLEEISLEAHERAGWLQFIITAFVILMTGYMVV